MPTRRIWRLSVKVGDIVMDDFYEHAGLVISGPRITTNDEFVKFGVMDGDIFEVVDVFCFDGIARLFTTDEVVVINASR